MYYEEKVINGELHWRGLPDGEWIKFTQRQLTERLVKLAKSLDSDNLPEYYLEEQKA